VPLTRGTDRAAVQALSTGVSDGVSDGVTGILKGIGNSPAVALNGVTGSIANYGAGRLYFQGVNPFAVPLPFGYNNAREASYGSAGTTGTLLAPVFVAPVFAGSSSLSVVPEEVASSGTPRFWSSPISFEGTRVYQRNDIFDPDLPQT